jgi:hypothetical protein
MRTRAHRGQTLVLLALTMLLVTLMVLVTLSLGVRVKERMELQTLADTAAYSNAVAAARTFNLLAVMNRTEWSLLATQSAAQAYLSWATVYRGAVEGLNQQVLPQLRAQCPDPAAQAALSVLGVQLAAERARVAQLWEMTEPAAHEELRRLSEIQHEVTVRDMQRNYRELEQLVSRSTVAKTLLELAQPSSPWPLRVSEDTRENMEELSRDCATGVACDLGSDGFLDNRVNYTILRHQHEMFYGTRGDAFTTAREDRRSILANRLATLLGGTPVVSYEGTGSSYRSNATWNHGGDYAFGPGNAEYPQEVPFSAFSDDHGTVSVAGVFGGCTAMARLSVAARVKSAADPNASEHSWAFGGATHSCPLQHDVSHTLMDFGAAKSWPLIIDFNDKKAPDEGDFFGQPVLDVGVSRHYSGDPDKLDPWELHFSFDGARFDNRPVGPARAEQRAVAKAVAYYHRMGGWQEPPNFMNPFWRATLLSSKVDKQ